MIKLNTDKTFFILHTYLNIFRINNILNFYDAITLKLCLKYCFEKVSNPNIFFVRYSKLKLRDALQKKNGITINSVVYNPRPKVIKTYYNTHGVHDNNSNSIL